MRFSEATSVKDVSNIYTKNKVSEVLPPLSWTKGVVFTIDIVRTPKWWGIEKYQDRNFDTVYDDRNNSIALRHFSFNIADLNAAIEAYNKTADKTSKLECVYVSSRPELIVALVPILKANLLKGRVRKVVPKEVTLNDGTKYTRKDVYITFTIVKR